jgi:hypothetical protein
VVGADDRAQVLRVEPRRQRCRADPIAEHHGQLPPLGLRDGDLPRRFASRQWRGTLTQRRDRFEELAAIADPGDADLLQILSGQLGKYRGVDAFVAKGRLGLLQPQAPQPRRNIAEPFWCPMGLFNTTRRAQRAISSVAGTRSSAICPAPPSSAGFDGFLRSAGRFRTLDPAAVR